MQKAAFSIIFFQLLLMPVLGQDFSFTCVEPTLPGGVSQITTFHADINNLSAAQIIFSCEFDTAGYPPEWYFSWCVGLYCLPPYIFVTTDTIEAGGLDSATVYLTPTFMQDSASVSMTVYPEGSPLLAQTITFTVILQASVEKVPYAAPQEFILSPAYPNPFNPRVQIDYSLAESGWVEAAVYNVLGRQAAGLYQGFQPLGNYHLNWDGCDNCRQELPSGIYYLIFNFNGQTRTAKVIKIK